RIADILRLVEMQPQELAVAGVGQFSQGAVLWADVQRDSALLKLHKDIGRALVNAGIATEARPYQPHITLARCKPQVPRNIIDGFLERNAALQLAPVAVRQFALYSSNASAHGPIYRVEKWFPADIPP
ncbi:MAG TPA: RNA 2',3'-cyclic phosphodiesterase, partial [Methylophilaceae bacterium]|nr:RNA 2',3'-cyclic phosphodiesterase [Methylophilaceae bacterium]